LIRVAAGLIWRVHHCAHSPECHRLPSGAGPDEWRLAELWPAPPLLVDLQPAGRFAGEDFLNCGSTQGNPERDERSTFGDDMIQAATEALADAKGVGSAVVHAPIVLQEVREQARLTQAQMAPLMGRSLSGYRKWKQGLRQVSGPAATLLRPIQKEPDVAKRSRLS
jgi:putative transcriptional regulator